MNTQQRYRARQRANGCCVNCGKPSLTYRCESCRKKNDAYSRKAAHGGNRLCAGRPKLKLDYSQFDYLEGAIEVPLKKMKASPTATGVKLVAGNVTIHRIR